MKIFKLITVLLVCLTISQSCKKDEVEGEAEVILKTLTSHPWSLTDAWVDGNVVTESFGNMTIAFSESNSFKVTNPVSPIWDSSGTFLLEETSNGFVLVRDDETVVEMVRVTNTLLELRFHYSSESAGGRIKSVSGEYTFQFQ